LILRRHTLASMFGAALLGAASFGTAVAQPGVDAPASVASRRGTPPGMGVLWQTPGRTLGAGAVERTFGAFAPDGRSAAFYDGSSIRIIDVADGAVVRTLRLGPARAPASALALSSSGAVAVGRVGYVDLYGTGTTPTRLDCSGNCGAVSAVAFSPDGRWLAYQGARGLEDRRNGLGAVDIVDMQTGQHVAALDAVTAAPRLAFSRDGRSLAAAVFAHLDDKELYGIRTWSTRDWRPTGSFARVEWQLRGLAPQSPSSFWTAYAHDGVLGVGGGADAHAGWTAPLIPPPFESSARTTVPTALDLVDLGANGRVIVSYESPRSDSAGGPAGTIVVRRGDGGRVEAMYDVLGVTDLAVAPDARTFLYTTGAGQTYAVLARVPF
jgi:hypothetical protein